MIAADESRYAGTAERFTTASLQRTALHLSRSAPVSLWVILAGGFAVTAAAVALGIRLMRPTWSNPETRRDLGVAVITAAVFSFAVFVLGVVDESRLRREEDSRQRLELRVEARQRAREERDSLRLQVALQKDLSGIDLRGRDLHAFFLRGKILREAQLAEADLRDANLAGADLRKADLRFSRLARAILDGSQASDALFNRADLRRATLIGATLTNADLSNANLRFANVSGANLTGASVAGLKVFGLQWDARTVWQDGKTRECSSPPCVVGGR